MLETTREIECKCEKCDDFFYSEYFDDVCSDCKNDDDYTDLSLSEDISDDATEQRYIAKEYKDIDF